MYLEKEHINELQSRIAQIKKDLTKKITNNQHKWLIAEKKLWEEKLAEIKKQGYTF